jgi:hypothetical protein
MRMVAGFVPLLLFVGLVAAAVRAKAVARPAPRAPSPTAPAPGPVGPGPTSTAPSLPAAQLPPGAGDPGLGQRLDRWVAAGAITADQRASIAALEGLDLGTAELAGLVAPPAEPAPARRRIPAIAEALGYLGGMLAVSGLALIVVNAWPDLSTSGRLVVSGVAAIVLLAAGWATPEHRDPALTRLRWFLWLAGTAATALVAGVAVDAADRAVVTVVFAAAATTALVGGLLWRGRERPLQQLSLLGGVTVAAAALTAEVLSDGGTGLVMWAVGAAYLHLGLRELVPGHRLFTAVGAASALVGSVWVSSQWQGPGLLFMMATAMALVGLAVLRPVALDRADSMLLGILGGFALLQGAPMTIGWYADGAGVATGLATWAIGGSLILLGVRQHTRGPRASVLLGGAVALIGAAVTGAQVVGLAPLLGIATAIGLVLLGARQSEGLVSGLGSLGLLVDVPWAIAHFFPGEGQVPLATVATGALFVALAVWLTRSGRGGTSRPRRALPT